MPIALKIGLSAHADRGVAARRFLLDAGWGGVRLRGEYDPGSDLFVVWSEGRETAVQGFPILDNRTFVVKFTRLVRF